MTKTHPPFVDGIDVATYRIPTDAPESDGTLEWDHTDAVVVHARSGERTGLGWSYASPAAASLIESLLRAEVVGHSALAIEAQWQRMGRILRNVGQPGAGLMAIAAVDIALWDLKARLLDLALVDLFDPVREATELYGSGGFTSYSEARLMDQLGGWVDEGLTRVKMKVGRHPEADPGRVAAARRAIGTRAALFVDANGGYSRKQAMALAQRFSGDSGVSWLEEPCSSNDLEGLRLLRDRGPAGMDVAAGEYGDTLVYFRRMLEAGAVDCLQADATRCGGFTGFLKVAALCEAYELPLSAHCAPQLHAHVGCATRPLRHVEYFHDHVRLEPLLFEGTLVPVHGTLRPDRGVPGHGLTLKASDAARYRI